MRGIRGRWAEIPRHALAAGVLATGLTLAASPLHAQEGAAPQPSPAPQQQSAQQQAPGLTFEGDAGLILMQIKPDKVAEFESVMAKLHEALTKSDKPERKQQASGWKIYKSTDPGPGGNVLYVALVEPALKGADYTVAKILYEVFPTEVQAIFPSYRDSFAAGLNRVNLNLVQDFGAVARPAPAPGAAAPESAAPPPAAPPQ